MTTGTLLLTRDELMDVQQRINGLLDEYLRLASSGAAAIMSIRCRTRGRCCHRTRLRQLGRMWMRWVRRG